MINWSPVSAGQSDGPLLNAGPCRAKPRGGCDGRIAQLVEQLTLNQRVQGSSPCAPTIEIKGLADIRQPYTPAKPRFSDLASDLSSGSRAGQADGKRAR
jgi:hypothetical protein